MEPIRSGTTTERIVRAIAMTTLINGFASAFLWDGHVGYARQNAKQLPQLLGLSDEATPPINPALKAAEAQQLMRGIPQKANRDAVQNILGPPSLEHGDRTYYVGPGGHLRVQWDRDQVAGIEWVDGIHTETDLTFQRWFGYVLGVFGAIYLVYFVRVLTFRASLTNAGLQIHCKPLIPFDAMKGLCRRDQRRGRRVELEYTSGGEKQTLLLEDYIIRKMPEIVTAICRQKGFTDPFNPDASGTDDADAS